MVKNWTAQKGQDVLDPVEIRGVKLRRIKDRLSREDLINSLRILKQSINPIKSSQDGKIYVPEQ